jgi:uncharacterized protein YggE
MDSPKPTNATSIQIDFRVVAAILLIVILAMFAVWRPWEGGGEDRTVSVTGQASLKAAPDEFVFYPTYEFKNADKQAALAAVTKKSGEVVAAVKNLGVADSGIKTNSDGYDTPLYKEDRNTPTYMLRITINVGNKELAQKVQDYLITTSPSGAVSPQATFSDAKRKELESKARDEATKDARSKAEQSAKNLGFGLGNVKTVSDGTGFGVGVMPAGRATMDAMATAPAIQQLTLQPGENELTYSVSVTYYVR